MRTAGGVTEVQSADMVAETPDPLQYHIGRAGATTLPVGDWLGQSPILNIHKDGVVNVEPEAYPGQITIDISKLTKEQVKQVIATSPDRLTSFATLARQAPATESRIGKFADQLLNGQNSTGDRMQGSATIVRAPSELPQLNLPNVMDANEFAKRSMDAQAQQFIPADPEPRSAAPTLAPVTTAPVGAPAIDMEALISRVTNEVAAQMLRPAVAPPPQPMAQAVTGVPSNPPPFIPRSRPQQLPSPTMPSAQQSVADGSCAPLALPLLGFQKPTLPTKQVVFQSAMGTMQVAYHEVVDAELAVVLVFDNRCTTHPQFLPSDDGQGLNVYFNEASYQVSPAFKFALGCLEIVVLLKEDR